MCEALIFLIYNIYTRFLYIDAKRWNSVEYEFHNAFGKMVLFLLHVFFVWNAIWKKEQFLLKLHAFELLLSSDILAANYAKRWRKLFQFKGLDSKNIFNVLRNKGIGHYIIDIR